MISFQNEGLIELSAITTFGISSKGGDNPIGYFGTGMKYAIAIILKHGGSIDVYRGTERLRFTAEPQQIRNDDFDVVHMNGVPLGFTTHMGVNWAPWQAFRELYSNTLDEGGTVVAARLEPEADKTTIHVSKFPAFVDAYYGRADIVLQSVPHLVLEGLEVHHGTSHSVYYRGIRVMDLKQPSLFRYNILSNSELTEDRTLKHGSDLNYSLARSIVEETNDAEFIEATVTAPVSMFEAGLPYLLYTTPSTTFLDVVQRLRDDSSAALLPGAREVLLRHRPSQQALTTITPNVFQQRLLDAAIGVANQAGFPLSSFPIKVVDALPGGALGMAVEDTIVIATRTFDRGLTCLIGTLMEEYIHLRYQYMDESRAFQDYVVDKMASLSQQLVEARGPMPLPQVA